MLRSSLSGAPVLPILCFLFLFPPLLKGDPRGEEIMEKVTSQPTPRTTHTRIRMILEGTDPQGVREEREMEIYARNEKGKSASLIRFLSPKEVRGVGLLVKENPTPPHEQWIYLPALKQEPKRVSASQRNQSFLGTDFTYADLEGIPLKAWRHEFLKEEAAQGVTTFVIRSTPLKEANAPYRYVLQWIHGKEYFPLRIQFFDEQGLLKELRVVRFIREGRYLLVQESVMENLRTHHRTILQVVEQKLDQDLPERLFTTRTLKEG